MKTVNLEPITTEVLKVINDEVNALNCDVERKQEIQFKWEQAVVFCGGQPQMIKEILDAHDVSAKDARVDARDNRLGD